MAKRMAAQQRGLLYGLVASVFVIIGLAVLLVLQMGQTKEAYLMFDNRAEDPEAVKANLSSTLNRLQAAGVTAPTVMDGTEQLLADLAAVQAQLKALADRATGASAPDVKGTALASWAAGVDKNAEETLQTKAVEILSIVPPLDIAGVEAPRGDAVPTNFAEALRLTEVHMRGLVSQHQTLKQELAAAEGRYQALDASLTKIKGEHEAAVSEIRRQSAQQVADAVSSKEASQEQVVTFEREKEATRRMLDDAIASHREELEQLKAQLLDLDSQMRKLVLERTRHTTSQFQVDGRVISIQPGSETAYISLGKGDGVFPNLTFAVFDPQELGKDEPEAKGYIRIVNVLQDSSEVRVINHKSASPVVRGDVLVNAVYDIERPFRFALVGKLDINGDGRDDRAMVVDMIKRFGGIVDEKASVDTDYIVVGNDPLSGIRMGDAVTPQERARTDSLRTEHEEMARALDLAQRVMIPVLNQNRFMTLVGMQPGSGR